VLLRECDLPKLLRVKHRMIPRAIRKKGDARAFEWDQASSQYASSERIAPWGTEKLQLVPNISGMIRPNK
jgi:hypothetical protein